MAESKRRDRTFSAAKGLVPVPAGLFFLGGNCCDGFFWDAESFHPVWVMNIRVRLKIAENKPMPKNSLRRVFALNRKKTIFLGCFYPSVSISLTSFSNTCCYFTCLVLFPLSWLHHYLFVSWISLNFMVKFLLKVSEIFWMCSAL